MKLKKNHFWAVLSAVFLSAGPACKADLLWSIDLAGNLKSINPYNASSSLVGTVTSSGNQFADVAYGFGYLWSVDIKGNVRQINPYTASSTAVGTITVANGVSMAGLAYGGGWLWSLDTAGNLRKVSTNNASSTLIGTVTTGVDSMAAVAYGGTNLWSLDTGGNLRIVNPANAASAAVGTISSGGYALAGLAYGAGSLWSLDVNGDVRKVNPANASSTLVGTVPLISGNSMAGLGYELQWTITTSSSPTYGGTATGAGTYADGTTASVSATANGCYYFTNWTIGGTVASTSAGYSFTATNNEALVANFPEFTYTLSTTSSPAGTGNESGGGVYYCNTELQITATPVKGYLFYSWSGTGIGSYTGTNNPATVTLTDGTVIETASYVPVPVFHAVNTHFGTAGNQFGFSITGMPNISVVIQACTNLVNPTWLPLQTNLLTSAPLNFSDAQWTNYHDRFYRFVVP